MINVSKIIAEPGVVNRCYAFHNNALPTIGDVRIIKGIDPESVSDIGDGQLKVRLRKVNYDPVVQSIDVRLVDRSRGQGSKLLLCIDLIRSAHRAEDGRRLIYKLNE